MNSGVRINRSVLGHVQALAHLRIDVGEFFDGLLELVRQRHEHEIGRGRIGTGTSSILLLLLA